MWLYIVLEEECGCTLAAIYPLCSREKASEDQLETSIDFIIFKQGPCLNRVLVAPVVFKLCKPPIPVCLNIGLCTED